MNCSQISLLLPPVLAPLNFGRLSLLHAPSSTSLSTNCKRLSLRYLHVLDDICRVDSTPFGFGFRLSVHRRPRTMKIGRMCWNCEEIGFASSKKWIAELNLVLQLFIWWRISNAFSFVENVISMVALFKCRLNDVCRWELDWTFFFLNLEFYWVCIEIITDGVNCGKRLCWFVIEMQFRKRRQLVHQLTMY